MHPIQPVGGSHQIAQPSIEREAPPVTPQSVTSATPTETMRPAQAPAKAVDVAVDDKAGPSVQSKPSQSDEIRKDPKASTQLHMNEEPVPERLVPPVPLRYLSAFMLQAATDRAEEVDVKA